MLKLKLPNPRLSRSWLDRPDTVNPTMACWKTSAVLLCLVAHVASSKDSQGDTSANTSCSANRSRVFTEVSWTYYKCQWVCATFGRDIADPSSVQMPFWECMDHHCVRPPVFRKFLRCRRKCSVPLNTNTSKVGLHVDDVCMGGCINPEDSCIGECHFKPSLVAFNLCRDRCTGRR